MKFIDGKPIHLFSTSVELESENVCVSPQNFGASWTLQKWLDLAEIWHTCSLGEYLGVFFSFFENFDFWGLGTSFSPKRGWQPGDFKNGRIWLKFGILVPWVNIWWCFFMFWRFWFLRPGDEFFAKTRLKLWAWRLQKWSDLAEIWHPIIWASTIGPLS